MTPSRDGISKPSICLVAHFAYGALSGNDNGHIGGVEHQTSLTARWFAARGYSVSMLTWDEGQPDESDIDGIRVIKMCRHEAGVRGLRFFHPRWTSLNRAMRRADAEVYYQNCGEYVTGQVALWCCRYARKFVYSVANDTDCDARLPEMTKIRERVLYRYGLRQADRVIVQTRVQQEMLWNGFGIDSVVIPMPCSGLDEGEYVPSQMSEERARRVLWLARICEQKRPDRLLDLAEACPDLTFDLVGPASAGAYAEQVVERAKRIPNVTVRGAVPRDRLPFFYQRASCFCSTSAFEGFPNTFLEAWSHGLPIVSTFDPDGLIAERGLGAVADDVPGLVSGIRELTGSPQRWRHASDNARRYYVENHAVETILPRFERVFLDCLNTTKRS